MELKDEAVAQVEKRPDEESQDLMATPDVAHLRVLLAAETMTILTASKNAFAFDLSIAVFPWLDQNGFVTVPKKWGAQYFAEWRIDNICTLDFRI